MLGLHPVGFFFASMAPKLASLLVVAIVTAMCVKATLFRGQLVLAGVLATLAIVAAAGRASKKQGLPKAAATKRSADEARFALPLAVVLLVPAALVAEKLDVQERAVGFNAVPVYVVCAWSYAASSWAKNAAAGETSTKAMLESIGFIGGVCAAALGFLTLSPLPPLAVVLGLAVPLHTFRCLHPRIGVQEAFLVASLCAVIAVDAVTNNALVSDNTAAPVTEGVVKLARFNIHAPVSTTVEHMVGRAVLVAVWITCAVNSAISRFATSAATRHIAACGALLVGVGVALSHVRLLQRHNAGTTTDPHNPHGGDVAWPPTQVSHLRLPMVVAWAIVIPLLSALVLALPHATFTRIVRRKLFHFIAVTAFLLPTATDPTYMAMWWCLAIGACTLLEYGRCHALFGLSRLQPLLDAVVDARDTGVIRTHLYLILGCGLSLILNHRIDYHFDTPPSPSARLLRDVLPGLGALGVLDAVAAIVGSTLGKVKLAAVLYPAMPASWQAANPILQSKTVEGTAAGWVALSVVGCGVAILAVPLATSVRDGLTAPGWETLLAGAPLLTLVRVVLVALGASVYEAVTDGVDNLEVPLATFALCRLVL
jgi:dolichol kinase